MHKIKMPKTSFICLFLKKHDILTLKIRFIEPLHDKTCNLDFASREDSDQPEHPPTLIRVFTVRTKNATKCHLLPIERTARTWIRPLMILIQVFDGHIVDFVGFVMQWLNYLNWMVISSS